MTDRACSKCQLITTESSCPKCKTSTLSDDFSGLAIIFDPQESAIAKVMEIKEKGRYAIKVR